MYHDYSSNEYLHIQPSGNPALLCVCVDTLLGDGLCLGPAQLIFPEWSGSVRPGEHQTIVAASHTRLPQRRMEGRVRGSERTRWCYRDALLSMG